LKGVLTSKLAVLKLARKAQNPLERLPPVRERWTREGQKKAPEEHRPEGSAAHRRAVRRWEKKK